MSEEKRSWEELSIADSTVNECAKESSIQDETATPLFDMPQGDSRPEDESEIEEDSGMEDEPESEMESESCHHSCSDVFDIENAIKELRHDIYVMDTTIKRLCATQDSEPVKQGKRSLFSRLCSLFRPGQSKEYCQKMSLDEYWFTAKKQRYSINKTVEALYCTGNFMRGDYLPLWSNCDAILGIAPSDLARFLREDKPNPQLLSALTCVFDAPPSFWKKVWKNRPTSDTAYFLPHFDFDPIIITDMLLNLSVGNDMFYVNNNILCCEEPSILTKHFALLVEAKLIMTQEIDLSSEESCFGPVGFYRVSEPTILVLGLTSLGESVARTLSLPGGLDCVVSASRGKPFGYFVEYAEYISRKSDGRRISTISRFLGGLKKSIFGDKDGSNKE